MELKVGTILILEPAYTDRIEKLRCKVVEQKDGIIFIDYPVNTMTKKTAFLIDGAQFRVTFHNKVKQGFVFTTEVLGRQGGNIPMIKLACPPEKEFIRIQRREYVRVQTAVDVAVEYNGQFRQFIADDISAGGVLLNLKGATHFSQGDDVQLVIVLPYANGEIRYIQTLGNVVAILERDRRQFASIQFSDTDDLDKQYVVRFCFERQLQLRKKEVNDF